MIKATAVQNEESEQSIDLGSGNFHGDQGGDIYSYLQGFGLKYGLELEKKCSKKEMKNISKRLRGLLTKLMIHNGKYKKLEENNSRTQSQVPHSSREMASEFKALLSTQAKVRKLLEELFECILALLAPKYSTRSEIPNNLDCNKRMYLYYSALSTESKILIKLLKKTLKEVEKLANECLRSSHLPVVRCNFYKHSIGSVQTSIKLQEKILKDSKDKKKVCKPYIVKGLRKLLATRNNRLSESRETVSYSGSDSSLSSSTSLEFDTRL
ncbi:hypothetical protein HWI79_311 [Cryptosporidium felis]|nr:hypothetical protein HWI79_311 [Cryptosporidium felis]